MVKAASEAMDRGEVTQVASSLLPMWLELLLLRRLLLKQYAVVKS